MKKHLYNYFFFKLFVPKTCRKPSKNEIINSKITNVCVLKTGSKDTIRDVINKYLIL